MKIATRARIGAVLTAPLLVVTVATVAGAQSEPEDGSTFTDRRTHTGPDGARSTEVVSCTGPEGEVYHRRETRTADETGEDRRVRTAGDPTACSDGNSRFRSDSGSSQGPALVNVNTGDVKILSPETPR